MVVPEITLYTIVYKLVKDKELSKKVKLGILKDWERRWSIKMANTTQSKEHLKKNLEEYNCIKDGIKKVEEK